MKRLCHFLIITIAFIIHFIFSLQSFAELRSPCVLTKSEKTLIAELTRMRSNDHAKIKECLMVTPNTLLIRYQDGNVGIFGIGKVAAFDEKQEMPNNRQSANEPSETTEQERRIFAELHQIWQSVDSPDDLSPEQLARADALVEELFAVTPANEIQLTDYNTLGLKGNRYVMVVQEIESVFPEALIPFYEGYLHNSTISRTEDIPADGDKKVALEKLMHIFETTELNKKYHFAFDLSQEIERIDPVAFEKLKQLGVVTENTD